DGEAGLVHPQAEEGVRRNAALRLQDRREGERAQPARQRAEADRQLDGQLAPLGAIHVASAAADLITDRLRGPHARVCPGRRHLVAAGRRARSPTASALASGLRWGPGSTVRAKNIDASELTSSSRPRIATPALASVST